MHNGVLFSISGKNVVILIDENFVMEEGMLVLSGGKVMPCDSLAFCEVTTDGDKINFKSVTRSLTLLENGDSTTINKLYRSGSLQNMLKKLFEKCIINNTQK